MKTLLIYLVTGFVTITIIFPELFNAPNTVLNILGIVVLLAYLYKAIPYFTKLILTTTKNNKQ